jgi:hypothetical protein
VVLRWPITEADRFVYGAVTLSGPPFLTGSTRDRLCDSAGASQCPEDQLLQPPLRNGCDLSRGAGLGSSRFARHYSGNMFPFLPLLRCFSSRTYLSQAYVFSLQWPGITPVGFPHSDTLGSQLARSSPRHFVACHVLHRLLAPRHPPRALCSLTSLSDSPKGESSREVRDLLLSFSTLTVATGEPVGTVRIRQKSKISRSFFADQHLHLVRCSALPGGPAVRWSVSSSSWEWSPPIRGSPVETQNDGSTVSRAVVRTCLDLRVSSGVYPIFSSVVVDRRRCVVLRVPVGRGPGVVETRRLELLTLSLQRRCSSS